MHVVAHVLQRLVEQCLRRVPVIHQQADLAQAEQDGGTHGAGASARQTIFERRARLADIAGAQQVA
ncbi:MAG TPA: hypothetical protein VMV01_10215 [Planctomycetota bacterium]|nr:hypothetical protein [Planctomycetota bacterium]